MRLQQHLDFALQAHERSGQARQQAGGEPLLTRARQRAGRQVAQRLALSQPSQVGRLRRWVSQQGHARFSQQGGYGLAQGVGLSGRQRQGGRVGQQSMVHAEQPLARGEPGARHANSARFTSGPRNAGGVI